MFRPPALLIAVTIALAATAGAGMITGVDVGPAPATPVEADPSPTQRIAGRTDSIPGVDAGDTAGTAVHGAPVLAGTAGTRWSDLVLENGTLTNASSPADPATDRLGWESGYWYNQTVAVDRSNGLNDTELDVVVARSMARVEEIRRIEFRETPEVDVISRQEFVGRYLGGSVPSSRRLFTNVKYEALLMVNESTDAVTIEEQNSAGGILGFYSFATESVTIVSENTSTPEMDEITLSQELFHALQDQRFDISSYDFSTQELHNARDGIVEGDGNYVDYLYERRCDSEWTCLEPQGSRVPDDWDPHRGLYQITLQPYTAGPAFVRGVRRTSGWEGVNRIYARPPASTEQTIHPGKYPSETPTDVSVPDRSDSEWRPLSVSGPDYESFGEGGLFVALWYPAFETDGEISIIPRSDHFNDGPLRDLQPYLYNHSSTAGWDGDKLVPYVRNGSSETNETGYVYRSVWDSTADASEFRRAYEQLLTHHGATPVEGRSNVYRIPDSTEFGDAFSVTRTGNSVLVVNAPSVADLSGVRSGTGVTGVSNPPAGVSPQTFDAAAGSDGSLERGDVVAVVRAFLEGNGIDGVWFSRAEVVTLIQYFLS